MSTAKRKESKRALSAWRLAHLMSTKYTAISALNDHHSVKRSVSPISQVPDDVMRYIFEQCLDPYPTLSYRDSPVLLSHVSHGWRCLALTMPNLWSTIKINLKLVNYESLLGIEEWFGCRSGLLPLDIYFDIDPRLYMEFHVPDSLSDFYKATMNIILSYHLRWRHLRVMLDLAEETTLGRIMALTPSDTPRLRTLDLSCWGRRQPAVEVTNLPILSWPTLKKSSGFSFRQMNSQSPSSPWPNLTGLSCSVDFLDLIQFADALGRCTALETLTYFVIQFLDPGLPQIAPIELPRLRHLTTTETLPSGFSFVTQLQAPKLESLMLSYMSQHVPPTIIPFLKQSPNIKYLLIGGKMDVNLFIEALRNCPQLTTLRGFPQLTDDNGHGRMLHSKVLARFVDADGTGDTVCPNLQNLSLTYTCLFFGCFNILEALVTRKTEASSSLARWSMLQLKVACKEEDKVAVTELLSRYDPFRIDITAFF